MIETTITCDHRYAESTWRKCTIKATCSEGVTSRVMMGMAGLEGWVSIKGSGGTKDYCPHHAAEHPIHGTVEQEMLANHFIQCECGKMHLPTTGTVVCDCGRTTVAWEACR